MGNEILLLNADGKRGKPVARTKPVAAAISINSSMTVDVKTSIRLPKLWSLERPQLYVVVTAVEQDGNVVNRYERPFGIRTIKFTADSGFFLNGKHVPLYGVCDHSDLGALGMAFNASALQRQLRIMPKFCVNAIRTSHTPPAPELLELCDQMGFLVMDEAFDCWATGKNKSDYRLLYLDWHEQDLRTLVRRDRNHLCVILWSRGNEVPDQDRPVGLVMAEQHRQIIHSEGPTRGCTAAVSSTAAGFTGLVNHFDVFGWNHKPHAYARFHKAHPGISLFGSETASTVSSRVWSTVVNPDITTFTVWFIRKPAIEHQEARETAKTVLRAFLHKDKIRSGPSGTRTLREREAIPKEYLSHLEDLMTTLRSCCINWLVLFWCGCSTLRFV